jgi:hypothetical protein
MTFSYFYGHFTFDSFFLLGRSTALLTKNSLFREETSKTMDWVYMCCAFALSNYLLDGESIPFCFLIEKCSVFPVVKVSSDALTNYGFLTIGEHTICRKSYSS